MTRSIGIGVVALAIAVTAPLGARAQDARLVLTRADVSAARAFASGLKAATAKGAARAFLAAKPASGADVRQRLLNLSVAYTAMTVERQIAELQRLGLDADPSSDYAQRVAQTRKQLDELTAPYRAVQAPDGRTALEVNKAIVETDLPAVQAVMADMRDAGAEPLPR